MRGQLMDDEATGTTNDGLKDFYLPRLRDIPDVGLMLEQTSRLVDGYLEPLGGVKLTPSMISNYVKHALIARPIRKLYYRQQIADLVFIALAKTVLQLDDIRGILDLGRAGNPAQAYARFCEEFDHALATDAQAGDAGTPACALEGMLRQVAVTCVHQIRLERFVRAALAQATSE